MSLINELREKSITARKGSDTVAKNFGNNILDAVSAGGAYRIEASENYKNLWKRLERQ